MSSVALLLGAAVASTLLLGVFVHWERTDQVHRPVVLILVLIVIEVALYDNESTIPRGIFHPGTGALEFRLPEVLISLALIARLVVRGTPKSIGVPAFLWAGYAALLALAAVEGVLRHNSLVKLPDEAKEIVYIVGAYALAAGVPVRRYIDARVFETLARWLSVAAVLLIAATLQGRQYPLKLPLLSVPNLGALAGDAGAIFLAVGLIALMLELAKDRRSGLTLLATVPLILTPFFTEQRASLLMLGAAVVVVILVALGPTARRRLRVNVVEVTLCALAVVAVVLAVSVVPAIARQNTVAIPLTATVVNTFESTGKLESAQARVNKWAVSWDAVKDELILGHGLGYEYSYFQPGPNQFIVTDITENIGLDLLLREGIVGLVFFLVALLVSLVNGMAVWRLHPDRMVGVFALALVAIVIGFMAKGQVESIFDNYREATFLGLTLGMLRSAVTSAGEVHLLRAAAPVESRV